MKLNNERLRAFYQAALDRSFHKAAANIFITQSALSQRISKLEQEIEATLFVRDNNGVRLTEAGSILFEYVRDLLYREQEIMNRVTGRRGSDMGVLRVASFSSVLRSVVMPSLRPLIQSAPDVFVEFFSRELRELPAMLESGEADFIVSDDSVNLANVRAIPLGHEEQVHVRRKGATPLSPPTFLDHDKEDQTTFQFFAAQGMPDIDIRRSYYDDVYGILDGVKLGIGEAVLSAHLLQPDDPVEVVAHDVPVTTPVILYHQENRYLTSLQASVIQQLTKSAAQYLRPGYGKGRDSLNNKASG